MDSFQSILIGAGHAAPSVASALAAHPALSWRAFHNRSPRELLGRQTLRGLPDSLADTHLLLLALPDDALEDCARRLAGLPLGDTPPIVAHLSPAAGRKVLSPLATAGCPTAVLHPLQSFRQRGQVLQIPWWGLCCADEEATFLKELLRADGAQVERLLEVELLPWHLSAVFTCNFLPALLDQALALWPSERRERIRQALLPILSTTLLHQVEGQRQPMGELLSGPLRRGDKGTLNRHLDWLEEHQPPEASVIYRLLSTRLLSLVEDAGLLPEEKQAELEKLLSHSKNGR